MDSATHQILRINKYVWFCLGFVLVYLLFGQQEGPFDTPGAVVWSLFAAGVASVTARTFFAIRPSGGEAHWNRVFNYLDIALLALLIAATGGIESQLWLVYFALMTFAALYADAMSKRLVDISVSALYFAATLPHQLNPLTAMPLAVYARTLVTHLFFLVMVSALARRTSADAEERNAELVRLREQMATAEERARIAREVHDSLGHAMVGTLLRLELCAKLLDRDLPEAKQILHEEIPALRAAWSEARDLAFHLRPWESDIAADGLVAALRTRCRAFAERTGIVIEFTCDDENIALRPASAYALMRIVQEALTNAARHAEASTIAVRMAVRSDGACCCKVSDDGCGFDVGSTAPSVGMAAMRERSEALGGSLHITSEPGCGTTVTVTIPRQ